MSFSNMYFIKRILYLLPTLAGVNLLVFFLFFMVNTPDHIAQEALGDKGVTEEQVLRWKKARGYDLPRVWNGEEAGVRKITQTMFYQKSVKMFWGDFGNSDMTLEPIWKELRERIPSSLCLTIPIFFVSLVVNVVFAMLSAAKRGTAFDVWMQTGCVFAMSVSSMIYIIGGQFLFARTLKLVPVSGFLPGADMLRFLALPVLIGVVWDLGGGIRFYRTVFLEETGRDYVRTARAKGLPESRVLFIHVLKNAMIPILTNVPVQMLMLIMGSLLLETFFSIPGMGGYTLDAINSQDFAVVRVMVFLGSVLYAAGLLLTDLCYALVDPRVRLS